MSDNNGVRIGDKVAGGASLSFEVYPPKYGEDSDLVVLKKTISKLSALHPDFISVTFGAGGGNRDRVVEIARFIHESGMIPLSHLTAVGYLKTDVAEMAGRLAENGVTNILALRGDIPEGIENPAEAWKDFRFASDLLTFLHADNRFSLGAATYPEGHRGRVPVDEEISFAVAKANAGAEYFITQLFFDNDLFFRFRDKYSVRLPGKPLIAGIMPILKARQVERMCSLSGATIPKDLKRTLERYASDDKSMEKAGIEFAVRQIEELMAGGQKALHLYSMNKSRQIMDICKHIFPGRVADERM